MTLRDCWTLARGPLLLATFMGCVVSLAAGGRVSGRLVVDGAVSFAFVPILQAAAFAVVFRRSGRPLPFPQAMDRFFATNAPWFVVLTLLAALTSTQTMEQTATWTEPPKLWIPAVVALVGLAWSAWIEIAFYRTALQRSRGAAIGDALVFRAIAWTLATIYFVGYAIPPMALAWIRG